MVGEQTNVLLELDFLRSPASAAEMRFVANFARESEIDFLGCLSACQSPATDRRTRITAVVASASHVSQLRSFSPRLRMCASHGPCLGLLDLVLSVLLARRAERVSDLGNDDHALRTEGVVYKYIATGYFCLPFFFPFRNPTI